MPMTDDERSLTISEFCEAEGFSTAKYHELQRKGLGPQELRFPGSQIVRITPTARLAWHAQMHALAQTQEGERERERRRKIASNASKYAVASPNHVSKKKVRGLYKLQRYRQAPEGVA
jgi:hypothetical protein